LARRLDHHPAARQEPVSDPGTHALAQDAGTGACALARAQIQQDADSRALSQSGLFRLRRLRGGGGGAEVFRQTRASGEGRRGGEGRVAGGRRRAAGVNPRPGRAPAQTPTGPARPAQPVLPAMPELGFITEIMAKPARAQPARAVSPAGAGSVNYVADWIMDV